MFFVCPQVLNLLSLMETIEAHGGAFARVQRDRCTVMVKRVPNANVGIAVTVEGGEATAD